MIGFENEATSSRNALHSAVVSSFGYGPKRAAALQWIQSRLAKKADVNVDFLEGELQKLHSNIEPLEMARALGISRETNRIEDMNKAQRAYAFIQETAPDVWFLSQKIDNVARMVNHPLTIPDHLLPNHSMGIRNHDALIAAANVVDDHGAVMRADVEAMLRRLKESPADGMEFIFKVKQKALEKLLKENKGYFISFRNVQDIVGKEDSYRLNVILLEDMESFQPLRARTLLTHLREDAFTGKRPEEQLVAQDVLLLGCTS